MSEWFNEVGKKSAELSMEPDERDARGMQEKLAGDADTLQQVYEDLMTALAYISSLEREVKALRKERAETLEKLEAVRKLACEFIEGRK